MAVIVPELTLYNIVTGLIKWIREDYVGAADKSTTMIYHVFNGLTDHKKNYYDQAVDVFTRDIENPRCVEARLFFDASRAKIPTIHITAPSDNSGENSIGVGESQYATEHLESETQLIPFYNRRFDSTFNVVCTSDNASEVLIMYHLIRAGLISIFDTVSLTGLENATLSGQELRIKSDLVPEHIFMRGIGIGCSYEVEVPRWWDAQKITDIFICPNGSQMLPLEE